MDLVHLLSIWFAQVQELVLGNEKDLVILQAGAERNASERENKEETEFVLSAYKGDEDTNTSEMHLLM